ncbi:MAG: hypothetical protein IH585_14735 [Anaerolineaceae bacterium]|nr:hypothetical protein [Anaerolineaceae bacterium]
MKTKFGIKYLILPIIITLFLLIPENIVWGGHSFQTVPTIGPSNTPTRTRTYTATQPISTQNSLNISSSTVAFISPATATTTYTLQATQPTLVKTPLPEKTDSILATDDPAQLESTSMVVLPVVSNGDSTSAEQNTEDENPPIPAFVFPLVVVLLFVVIYLSTKFSLKKSLDEKSSQDNK